MNEIEGFVFTALSNEDGNKGFTQRCKETRSDSKFSGDSESSGKNVISEGRKRMSKRKKISVEGNYVPTMDGNEKHGISWDKSVIGKLCQEFYMLNRSQNIFISTQNLNFE